MVLAAFVLVLAAAVTFAAGIATSRTSDGLVYVSILLSLAAFAILAIASIRARQAAREGGGADEWTTARTQPMDTDAATGPLLRGLDESQLDMAPNWKRDARHRWRDADAPVATDDLDEELDRMLEAEEDEADTEVPVDPLPLPALSDEEGEDEDDWRVGDDSLATAAYAVYEDEDEPAEDLEEFEEIGDLNFGIRADDGLDDAGLEAPAFEQPLFERTVRAAVEREPVFEPEPVAEFEDVDDFDFEELVDEEEDVSDLPAPSSHQHVSAGGGSSLDLIDDYDDLTAAEIVPRLDELELADLRWVQGRERAGGKRTAILNAVDDLIAGRTGGRRTRTPAKAAAKKTPARKAPAKKAAKKSTAKKTTSKAKKATTRAKKTATRAKKASPSKRASKRSG